ncbi:hypothetical protein HY486_01190 [Candidatus Woesearchaeota archaeon]|nr:hypothetical protein [Candidatus Woesearchaeota archaeon]
MKAQILTQTIVFILAAFVFILIIYFGYKAIAGFQDKQEKIALLEFKQGLEIKVDELRINHGNIDELLIRPPADQVCFIDPEYDYNNPALKTERPILVPVFKAKAGNVILLKKDTIYDKFYMNDIKIGTTPSYCCYSTRNALKLKLEGYKGKALISSWNTLNCIP